LTKCSGAAAGVEPPGVPGGSLGHEVLRRLKVATDQPIRSSMPTFNLDSSPIEAAPATELAVPDSGPCRVLAALDVCLTAERDALLAADLVTLERVDRDKIALARELARSVLAAPVDVRSGARADLIRVLGRAQVNRDLARVHPPRPR
jgi:hypothetical protein